MEVMEEKGSRLPSVKVNSSRLCYAVPLSSGEEIINPLLSSEILHI